MPSIRQIRALVSRRVCAWITRFVTARDRHLRDRVAAHIYGGAARLTETRVSLMQRKTKRRPGGFAAERRRAAPYARPDKISSTMFLLVRGVHNNPLRSRERRFESCGHWSKA
jgi:hypothetical protein